MGGSSHLHVLLREHSDGLYQPPNGEQGEEQLVEKGDDIVDGEQGEEQLVEEGDGIVGTSFYGVDSGEHADQYARQLDSEEFDVLEGYDEAIDDILVPPTDHLARIHRILAQLKVAQQQDRQLMEAAVQFTADAVYVLTRKER